MLEYENEFCKRLEERYEPAELVEFLGLSVRDIFDSFEHLICDNEDLIEECGLGLEDETDRG